MSGGGMSQFYGQMPDNFTLVVNGNHPIVIDILQTSRRSTATNSNRSPRRSMPPCRRRSGSRRRSTRKGGGAHRRGEKPARGVVEEGRHAARRTQRTAAPDRREGFARAADHRPGTAHQRDAQRQKPDGVHPAIDLADREISGHGTRSIKRGYVLSGHIPFWCVYNRKSTASLSDAGSSPPPHAADCNSPKLVQYRPPALNRTGNQT